MTAAQAPHVEPVPGSTHTVMNMGAKASGLSREPGRIRRRTLSGVRTDRLYFAQVREDPLLEIDALGPGENDTIVVVSSGGCTALSLLARGAGHVVAVDVNATQNHILELKAVACDTLDSARLLGFLGGAAMSANPRLQTYAELRPLLTPTAAAYWDVNSASIANGVLNAGVSERFIGLIVRVVETLIHPRERIGRLLACETLAQQRELFQQEWNSRRWRMLFGVLMNGWVFKRTYDPGFFENVENPSFARHFRRLFEHALCEVPVQSNYFLHYMLQGRYPVSHRDGVPPYLDPWLRTTLRTGLNSLELVDGGYTDYLELCDDSSVDSFALSNICEWLTAEQTLGLFRELIRVAKPKARVCFRNFVGHTEVPPQVRHLVVEDVPAGRAAIRRDRSCVQSRIAICRVEK